MARIVGSSFKAPIIQRTGPQETAMDRALASFVSPAGVYLLAQGIGALGKLPFRSKEGGVDMVAEAARKKSAAVNQLRDAQLTKSQLKPGRTGREVVEQRDRMAPRDTDRMPDTVQTPTQRAFSAEIEAIEGQKKLQMQRATQLEMLLGNMSADDPDRAAVVDQRRQALGIISELKEAQDKLRPKDKAAKLVDTKVRELSDHMRTGISSETRGATVPEQRMLDMIGQARREGRASTAADVAELSESAIRERIEQELPTPKVIQEAELEDLSIQELQDLADRTRKDLKRFGAQSKAFQDKFGEQINPLIVQQNIDKSVEARMSNRTAINNELQKRQRELEQRKPVSFLSAQGQKIAGLTPFQQKQELRRMARAVTTTEDAEEVRNLLSRFAPARETIGDYFRSDDDIATEFEKEITDLIPAIDPLAGLKRQELESRIRMQDATTGQRAATAQATRAGIGEKERVAEITAAGKREQKEAENKRKADEKAEKQRNAKSARSKAQHDKEVKRAMQRAKENARMIKDPSVRALYLDATDKLIRDVKRGEAGTLITKINNALRNDKIKKSLEDQEAARKLDQEVARQTKEALAKIAASEGKK